MEIGPSQIGVRQVNFRQIPTPLTVGRLPRSRCLILARPTTFANPPPTRRPPGSQPHHTRKSGRSGAQNALLQNVVAGGLGQHLLVGRNCDRVDMGVYKILYILVLWTMRSKSVG